jgi:hypothetical protein
MESILQQGQQGYRNFLRKSVILLLYIFTTGIVLFVFIVRPGINGYDRAMFPDMVYGKAYKPFVYRTLLPIMVRAIAKITPEAVQEEFNTSLQNKRMVKILKWEKEYLYEYSIALILMFCCFLGFAFMLRYLIKQFYEFPSFVADFAPVGGLLILPIFFKYYSYLYDPLTLLLFTLALIAIAKRNFTLFYIVFLLTTLNKETSILLTGIFFIREFKVMRNPSWVKHILLQIAGWIAIKSWITAAFKNNPGSFVEFHLLDCNLGLISNPQELLYFIMVITVFAILIRYRWSEKPTLLKNGLFITLIPLSFSALFFGCINELRMYYEAFPFIFLLSLPTVVDVFELSPADTPRS